MNLLAFVQEKIRPGTDLLDAGQLGLCGEAGEIAEHLKKWRHQGHPFNRDHLIAETGDVLFYVGVMCLALGVTLEEVQDRLETKLNARYPNGFEAQRSLNREPS